MPIIMSHQTLMSVGASPALPTFLYFNPSLLGFGWIAAILP